MLLTHVRRKVHYTEMKWNSIINIVNWYYFCAQNSLFLRDGADLFIKYKILEQLAACTKWILFIFYLPASKSRIKGKHYSIETHQRSMREKKNQTKILGFQYQGQEMLILRPNLANNSYLIARRIYAINRIYKYCFFFRISEGHCFCMAFFQLRRHLQSSMIFSWKFCVNFLYIRTIHLHDD